MAATIREIVQAETGLAHEALALLRPSFADLDVFVARVDEVQRASGYRLVGAFEDGVESARAVAGFRIGDNLAWGHHLYVDDLSTVGEARGRGHARGLLDWLVAEARARGCGQLHLDSGVGPDRATAHRLYLQAGMRISSHHFQLALD